jgi:sec-independent protein translocase protein TatA
MGTVGYPEMVFIFLLALVLFGPKKLPEIGRTLGKAMTEFRRASNELKSTFEREMRNIEQETGSLKELAGQVKHEIDFTDPRYTPDWDGVYVPPSDLPPADDSPVYTTSASATQGAESPSATAPEGAVAHSEEIATATGSHGDSSAAHAAGGAGPEQAASASTANEPRA